MSGGDRKYGRNLKKCKRYREEHREEKNKARRARKRAKQMPGEEG